MKNKIEKALDDFAYVPKTETEEEFNKKVSEEKRKYIKSDHAIIERIDQIIITENGKQLLRERY